MKNNGKDIIEFFKTEFNQYATYDTYRSLANYTDGLKNSGRKVIHTVIKNNIKNNIKISALAAKTIEQAEYLHGEMSLQKVCISLARNFSGTNNLNVLEPEGSFGNRTIPLSASPRYIYTRKIDFFDNIFVKDDLDVLINQDFEDTQIEPRFFVPVLPLILLNYNKGIGSGFSQKIYPREPKKILSILKKYLKTKKLPREIKPFFKDFKGEIEVVKNPKTKVKNIIMKGVLTIKNQSTILIEELPVKGYTQKSYLSTLEKLIDKGLIKTYKDFSNENNFLIEIKVERQFIKNNSQEELLSIFNLIHTDVENFTCIDENNKVIVFKNEIEILQKYIDTRIIYYSKRKENIINLLKEDIDLLSWKLKFLDLVLNEKIILNKAKKEIIIKNLTKYKFPERDSYGYLLNMPLYSLTYEKYQELKSKQEIKQNELNELLLKKEEDLWLEDLNLIKL